MQRLYVLLAASRVFVAALVVLSVAISSNQQSVFAAELIPRSIKLSNSLASQAGVDHELALRYATDDTVGSILIRFCDESPILSDPCSQPPGFDASSVTLSAQTGATGFVVYGGSTINEIILTRPSTPVSAGTNATYTLSNIQNPSDDGTLYARVLTFASSDASGSHIDAGGLALAINPAPTIQAEVPPFLIFCLGESISGFDCTTATEPFSNIGTLGPLVTGAAQTQLLVATNGSGGYSLRVLGGTMTSGNNVLPAMVGEPSQKGVSQFGMNLRANTAPIIGQNATGPGVATVQPDYNVPNEFRYQSGDVIASASAPDDFRKYTVSYVVNVVDGQPGGVYATTLTYIALANF
jgi:hypothetical protein